MFVKQRNFYYWALILGGALSFSVPSSWANNLNQIQQKIQQQTSKINEQKQKRIALQSTLKTQEIEMGKVLDKLQKPKCRWVKFVKPLKLPSLRSSVLKNKKNNKREVKRTAGFCLPFGCESVCARASVVGRCKKCRKNGDLL